MFQDIVTDALFMRLSHLRQSICIKNNFVSVSDRLCVSQCFDTSRHGRAETWQGGEESAPEVHGFRSNLTKGQMSSRGQVALKIPYDHQIWQEEPLTKVKLIPEGERSCRGQSGSTRGQYAQECPMASKFGRNYPDQSATMILLGSRVMQGPSGINQWSNCLEQDKCYIATKFLIRM